MEAVTSTQNPDALTRDDWIDAAMDMLIDGGIEAVRITRLAKFLGVSRGSFYWHFNDRSVLLEALCARWTARNTPAIAHALRSAATLDEGILSFFDAWLLPGRFDPRLDQAIRAWARADGDLTSLVEAADATRVDLVAAHFRRFGYTTSDAFIRARILYFAQIGYYALGVRESMADRATYLETYFRGFTGREIDGAIASRFLNRHDRRGISDD